MEDLTSGISHQLLLAAQTNVQLQKCPGGGRRAVLDTASSLCRGVPTALAQDKPVLLTGQAALWL